MDGTSSGKSDLYTFFYLRSLHLLNKGGVHCLICSNSWLDVGYGVWMQEFLLENVPVHYVIDNHARRSFSTVAINTIISLFDAPDKNYDKHAHIAKFIAFRKPFVECIFTENIWQLHQAKEIIKNEIFRIYPITAENLYDEGWETEEGTKKESGKYTGNKWGGKYLKAPDVFFDYILKKNEYELLFNKIKVEYGTKTGAVNFFIINDETIKKFHLEQHSKLFLDSSRHINDLLIDNDSLVQVFSYNPAYSHSAQTYIKWGEKEGYHLRQSLKGKKNWYKIEFTETNLVLLQFFDKRFFSPFSEKKIAISNSFWGITDYGNYDKHTLYCFLNSIFYFLQLELFGRCNMGEGVLTIYGNDFDYIIIPLKLNNTKYMSKFIKRPVMSIYEECGIDPESKVPIEEQEPKPLPDRKELDDIVFDALGLTEEERKDVYRAVCRLVWNRLSKAKSV